MPERRGTGVSLDRIILPAARMADTPVFRTEVTTGSPV